MKKILRYDPKIDAVVEYDAAPPVAPSLTPACPRTYRDSDPLIGNSAGFLPHQVPLAREEIRKRNIRGVEVRPDGSLSITSRLGRKLVNQMRGMHDGDGGYGD